MVESSVDWWLFGKWVFHLVFLVEMDVGFENC
jgi:hypothetical protein